MPTVPTYDNFQAMPNQGGPNFFGSPSGQGAGEIGARQMEGLGQSMQGAGTRVAQIASAMQQQVDMVRVNDAVNQARKVAQDLAYNPQTGYLNLKGDAALTRPDGASLPEEYGTKLQDQLDQIAGTLGNENQRRQFLMNAGELRTQFSGQVEQHLLGEFRSHALSVQDGTIALASEDAKTSWNDPDTIAKSLASARAAVVQKGVISGWSASETDAMLLATTGKVHTDVILSALENNNPNYAQAYLEAHRKEMTGDDILRVQGHVNQQTWQVMAQSAVQTASTSAMPKFAPTSFDRMVAITESTESGGKDFGPNGQILTSSAGAKGRMQVMDDTMANPGLPGVTPLDPKTATPEQRAQFGQQYLQALMQKYGDPAMAWAAYNGGMGRVDKAVAAAKNEHTGAPGDWLAFMPAETRAYVAKNMQALQSGGAAAKPTELDFVQTALSALPPGAPPQVVQLTRERALQQYSLINKSVSDTADAALANAQRWLAGNPGATLDQVPPSLIDPLKQYAPGKLDDLAKYATALGRNETKTDLVLYNRLASHPDEMARMSDAQFESLRAHLAPADFKHFSNERQQVRSGASDTGAGSINTEALNAALNTRLQSLGINPAPPGKDTDGQARVGGIRQFVRDDLFRAQQQLGRKLTPEEVEKHIDKLFATSVSFRDSLWGTTGTETLMAMQVSDLPSNAYEGLKAALIQSGRANPTDNDILNLYRKLHTRGTN